MTVSAADMPYWLQYFLERTNPNMLPAASSIFFTLDSGMNGEVRFKVSKSPYSMHLLLLLRASQLWQVEP